VGIINKSGLTFAIRAREATIGRDISAMVMFDVSSVSQHKMIVTSSIITNGWCVDSALNCVAMKWLSPILVGLIGTTDDWQ